MTVQENITPQSQGCTLCPRRCKRLRNKGERGLCGAGSSLRVARAALHLGEEPPISGSQGSGTVFFAFCPLSCVYCQNREISQNGEGKDISVERLSEIFLELERKQAHNINLVSPTHFVPEIIKAVSLAREKGLLLPILYNSSGYELPETITSLSSTVEIYLTDFKYWDDALAQKYSRVKNYTSYAKTALKKMVENVGRPRFLEGGVELMEKGVIVRHLLLPGRLENAKRIVEYLHVTFDKDIRMSLMGQFTPLHKSIKCPELNERVSKEEYERLLDFADRLGVNDYYYQLDGSAEESFIPSFDGTGV